MIPHLFLDICCKDNGRNLSLKSCRTNDNALKTNRNINDFVKSKKASSSNFKLLKTILIVWWEYFSYDIQLWSSLRFAVYLKKLPCFRHLFDIYSKRISNEHFQVQFIFLYKLDDPLDILPKIFTHIMVESCSYLGIIVIDFTKYKNIFSVKKQCIKMVQVIGKK